MGTLGFSIEVIVLPVTDVERALRFYVDQVGFLLDVDYAPTDAFRVVQLTPPGLAAPFRSERTDRRARQFTSQHLSRRHGSGDRAQGPARTWGHRQRNAA